jgi:hypothetical protein
MGKYRLKEDCTIMREEEKVTLLDCDGDEVFSLPPSWTDEQIWTVLKLQNIAYSTGVCVGRAQIQSEIREVLGISANNK